MAFEMWLVLTLKILFVILGGHLAITKLLPILKKTLNSFLKQEEITIGIISIFLFYVGALVLEYLISLLIATGNEYLNYANVLMPAVELILTIVPYVFYFMIAAVIALGLKK